VISLYPLALLLAVVAVTSLRSAVLPRWLGVGAAVTAAALVINGSVPTTDNVPALILFVLWTLAASITLYRKAGAQRPELAHGYSTASV
jgi:steroid 5-alpha reductase family enzyme